MKFIFSSVVASILFLSCEAINTKYKQSGSEVDRSRQVKKSPRQHGGAIVKRFKGRDEVSFKIGRGDKARVVMASDFDDVEYSIAQPGRGRKNPSYKKLDRMGGAKKRKEEVNGQAVDAQTVKLRNGRGGEVKVKAEIKGNGKKNRSLAESTTVAILNPGSRLNVCYETVKLVNYVGEPIEMKVSLCDIKSGLVHSGDDGVLSGTFEGNDGSELLSIPQSSESGWSVISFTPTSAGMYSFVIDVDAQYGGEVFERQASDSIMVVEKQLESIESVSIGMEDDSAKMVIKVILADGYVPSEDDAFIVSADIVDGMNQTIVTASAMADMEAESTLQVIIQPEWFPANDISGYSVEYLRISSANLVVPLIIAEGIPIEATSEIFHRRRLSESAERRDLRMSQGIRPPQSEVGDSGNLHRQLQSTQIIASHGWCSGDAWRDDLPGTDKFEDFDQNRSHREFAELLLEFGESYESGNACSIIAHSQGGLAALTLHAYYWSCLDNGDSDRRLIQSVGTPYQGTSLAKFAPLGSLFGVGCGLLVESTYVGASLFLLGIPFWARSAVNYYTTSFEFKLFRYDYCNIVTDIFLDDPDDGTTERWAGQLLGANNRGHTEGWCHIRGMRDPPQTTDSMRNAEMLAYAA